MRDSALPVIADYRPDRVFAWRMGQPVRCARAVSDVQILGRTIAQNTPYINLCEDRYSFTLAFAGVGLAGGFNLLPQSRAPDALRTLREDYPEALTIDDNLVATWLVAAPAGEVPRVAPSLTARRRVAVVFTSGSTGRPGRHDKCWGGLVRGAHLYRQRFFARGERLHTVVTVPPQHMYGLETSILPALRLGFAVDTGRPFMPWTVAETLARLPAQRLLVTTPAHLRACIDADATMPEIERVISAAAPLDPDLARAIESAWKTRVYEIYGCTETGSVASRRTVATDIWSLYDGMSMAQRDGVWLSGPQLSEPFRVSDNLEVLDPYRFRWLGRSSDMLKTGGKRMSLHELTRRLLAIEGIDDAVAFEPSGGAEPPRPAALVVAPRLGARQIAARLAQAVDPVFVPRPLLRVDALPRDALGKLPRSALLELLQRTRGGRQPT